MWTSIEIYSKGCLFNVKLQIRRLLNIKRVAQKKMKMKKKKRKKKQKFRH